MAYRFVAPEPVRRSVGNFLHNLRSPVIFVNDILQGERDRAGVTLGRFMINTTLGVFGLFDPATAFGHQRHDEDFGQTLAVYGVPDGPYLMLPLLGPVQRPRHGGACRRLLHQPAERLLHHHRRALRRCSRDRNQRARGQYRAVRRSARQQHRSLRDAAHDLYPKRAADVRNGAAPTDQNDYDDIFKDED